MMITETALRFRAERCEICGTWTNIDVHHVRRLARFTEQRRTVERWLRYWLTTRTSQAARRGVAGSRRPGACRRVDRRTPSRVSLDDVAADRLYALRWLIALRDSAERAVKRIDATNGGSHGS
ncbi:hypothetical protein [Dactylosporangium sp. NPDC000521]|uniref:hypothetical protein n=1 Tax=Dactylosporangium sp. NPDC000521 TaxID=3363975 RepID=UPI0036AFE31B